MIASALPCAATSLQRAIASMLDDLARALPTTGNLLTRIGIGLLPIEDASPLAHRYEVGSAASTLLRQAISRSLVFSLVDSKTIDAALRTVEKELAEGKAPASGEALSEEIEYFIVGSVTQEGELFRIVLRLIETSTTAAFATVDSTFPVTDLVALGESLSKPFAYIGPFGAISWDTESPKGGSYGPFLYSTGISALLPLKTVYAKLGLEYLGAEGAQSESYLGKTYGLPPGASGKNSAQSLLGYLGFGIFMPIRYGIYGHGGLDIGFGSVWDRTLYQPQGGAPGSLAETNPLPGQLCVLFGLDAGVAIKLGEHLALDAETGVDYRIFRFFGNENESAGNISIPLRVSLAYPF
jgi:hypothetical protein